MFKKRKFFHDHEIDRTKIDQINFPKMIFGSHKNGSHKEE